MGDPSMESKGCSLLKQYFIITFLPQKIYEKVLKAIEIRNASILLPSNKKTKHAKKFEEKNYLPHLIFSRVEERRSDY